jgi:hypothetical protein
MYQVNLMMLLVSRLRKCGRYVSTKLQGVTSKIIIILSLIYLLVGGQTEIKIEKGSFITVLLVNHLL